MTPLIGKDAPLEVSLNRFREVLRRLHLEVTETDWLNPLPQVFSVRLELVGCPVIGSNGKGTSREAALASAYGELLERLGTHAAFSDFYLGLDNAAAPFAHYPDEKWVPVSETDPQLPEEILTPSLRKFYCQDTGLVTGELIDLQTSSFSRGVCCLPFANARNGSIAYFPVNLLDNLYATNGMSAGNTEYETLVQAISEILERYVSREIISRGLALPRIPAEILQRCPAAGDILRALQGGGLQAICCDASLGGKFPVVCVILCNQRNGTCCASFGAHPIFAVALERTLTELMQGRTFSDLDNLEEPTFDLTKTSDPVNLESHFLDAGGLLPMQLLRETPDFKFVAWDFSGTTHEQYKALRYMIAKAGFDVYVRACPLGGVPVYRVVVPGMSEIYPRDDLVYNNTNRAIDFQESLLTLPQSHEQAEVYGNYLTELEHEDLDNGALICPALGVLPDPRTAWATLRLGELKCLLALAAAQWSPALTYASWTLNFNRETFPLERRCFYQCLIRLLQCRTDPQLDENAYHHAANQLYGPATVARVIAHLCGQERFCGLTASDLNLRGFTRHRALIKIYAALKAAGDARA